MLLKVVEKGYIWTGYVGFRWLYLTDGTLFCQLVDLLQKRVLLCRILWKFDTVPLWPGLQWELIPCYCCLHPRVFD